MRGQRATKPGIVTDVHQHGRLGDVFTHFFAEDDLVTDRDRGLLPGHTQRGLHATGRKIGHRQVEHATDAAQHITQRHVLTKGHEVLLVIDIELPTERDHAVVVTRPFGISGGLLDGHANE